MLRSAALRSLLLRCRPWCCVVCVVWRCWFSVLCCGLSCVCVRMRCAVYFALRVALWVAVCCAGFGFALHCVASCYAALCCIALRCAALRCAMSHKGYG